MVVPLVHHQVENPKYINGNVFYGRGSTLMEKYSMEEAYING